MFGTYRLFLACVVALSHYGLVRAGFMPGQWAVISFYVLSGYLMECQFQKLGNGRLFYEDRFLRIYPLFAVVLLLTVLLTHPSLSAALINGALLPLNYANFLGVPLIIGPSWSLACEAHYYILVPLFSRAGTACIRWLMLGSVGLFVVSPFLPQPAFWGYAGLPGILFAFLSGLLLKRKDLVFLVWLWIFFLIMLAVFAYSKMSHAGLPTGIHINVCVGYLVALPVIFRLAKLSPRVPLDQKFGLLAYPLFLAHEPVRELVLRFFEHVPMVFMLASAIAVSSALVLLVEKPFDSIRYRNRLRPKS